MSKIWLLLLLVAALQYAQAYPAEYEIDDVEYMSNEVDDYMSDEETTWGILKETWNKLKDRYKTLSKEKMKKIIALLKDKFCSGQEDMDDEFESDETQDSSVLNQYKIVQEMKKLYEKAKQKWGEQKEKLKEAIADIRAKFCAKLNDVALESDFYDDGDDNDEERGIKWGKVGKTIKTGLKKAGKGLAKGLKKLKGPMKKLMKKGAEIIKKAGIKINPLQCEEKTCKSCIILRIPMEMSFCVQMRFMKTNKATYLVVSLTKDDVPKFEQKLKLGEMPRCLNVGGAIGKICLKGIEGRAKSSQGQPKVNFCLAIVAENFGVGCKFCASYENKKLKVKFQPTAFPGGTDESGDIVQLDKNGEDGTELAADEFEED